MSTRHDVRSNIPTPGAARHPTVRLIRSQNHPVTGRFLCLHHGWEHGEPKLGPGLLKAMRQEVMSQTHEHRPTFYVWSAPDREMQFWDPHAGFSGLPSLTTSS